MYNRYTRNDTGKYRRTESDAATSDPGGQAQRGPPPNVEHPDPDKSPPCDRNRPQGGEGRTGLLSSLTGLLNGIGLDTGDLLLLLLLALVFREGEDDELLIALAMLLIG